MYYNAVPNFSVWLITGYNPPDINRFRSDTGKAFKFEYILEHPPLTKKYLDCL